MCQTDPEIFEPRSIAEPLNEQMPPEDEATPNVVNEPLPENEEMYVLMLPEVTEIPEEIRDWAKSELYKYVEYDTIKSLLAQGKIKLSKDQKLEEDHQVDNLK